MTQVPPEHGGAGPAPPAPRRVPPRPPVDVVDSVDDVVFRAARDRVERVAAAEARAAAADTASPAAVAAPERPKRRQVRKEAAKDWPSGFRSLTPPVDVDGPRVRLGILWFVVMVVATILGPLVLAGLLGFVAVAAAGQTCRSWAKRVRRPVRAAVVIGAPLPVAAAAVAGLPGVLAVGVAVAVGVGLGWRQEVVTARRNERPAPRLGRSFAIVAAIALATAAPVLLHRSRGFVPVIALFLLVAAYDSGAFLIGSGARSRWEGPVAGIAAVVSMTIAIAAVFVPPFRGFSPFVVGALAVVLAPGGTLLATALLGDRTQHVPALRRLDSMLLLAPAFYVAALALVDPPLQ